MATDPDRWVSRLTIAEGDITKDFRHPRIHNQWGQIRQ
jgi:hypothetical protein